MTFRLQEAAASSRTHILTHQNPIQAHPQEPMATVGTAAKCHRICRSYKALFTAIQELGGKGRLKAKVKLHKFTLEPQDGIVVFTFKSGRVLPQYKTTTFAKLETKIGVYYTDLRGIDIMSSLESERWGFGKRIEILEIID